MKKYKVIHMGMSYEFEAHGYTIDNKYGDCYEFFIEEKDGVRRAVVIMPKKHTVITISSDIDIKVLNSNVNILND